MKKLLLILVFIAVGFVVFQNYSRPNTEEVVVPTTTPAASQVPSVNPDAWLGKWTGPEGTALTISKTENRYTLAFEMLDGPISVVGSAAPEGIIFTRDVDGITTTPDSKTFILKHGSGKDTGMKWLEDKQDCLVVQPSEGYCRD